MIKFNEKNLNAFKFGIKNINGRLYRINNFVNINKVEEINNKEVKPNIREFKLVQRLNSVLSDDDATSEEDYSGNVSFLDDESDRENDNYNKQIDSKYAEDIEDINMNDVDNLMLSSIPDNKSKYSPKIRWTHFLAIPFNVDKQFVDKFEFFKSRIIEENFSDIDENLFQKTSRLHMTICLFSIEENKRKEKLTKINRLMKESEEIIKKILEENPLHIDFDQLEIIGNHNQTKVLFTRPHMSNSEKLKDVIDALLNKFIENEILTEQMKEYSHIFYNEMTERYEIEKLHVTLLNSSFMLRDNINKININTLTKQDSNLISKSYFNGMKIIKRMKNFSFGIHRVNEIVLNEMKIDKNSESYVVIDKFII